MYARGSGYFRLVLPKMGLRAPASGRGGEWGGGQGASFFCLDNAHWRIIAVDTAYESTQFDWGRVPVVKNWKWLRKSEHFKPRCELPEKLLVWLRSTVNPDGDKRGIIVLSHHGAFSSFGEWYRTPARQLAEIIHRPVIWFWGHEHKFTIYDRFAVSGGVETTGGALGTAGCRWSAARNRTSTSAAGSRGTIANTTTARRLMRDTTGTSILRAMARRCMWSIATCTTRF